MSSISPITTESAARTACGLAATKVAVPSAIVHLLNLIGVLLSRNVSESDAEKLVQHGHFGVKLRGREVRYHTAALHYVEAVGERRGEPEVLLHHDDGVSALAQAPDGARQRLHDDRSEPLGDLIEQQQPCAGAQDARERQHLLLAARKVRPLAAAAFAQVGEHLVDLLDR